MVLHLRTIAVAEYCLGRCLRRATQQAIADNTIIKLAIAFGNV